MIASDHYLRHLPAGLDKHERMILESLVTSSDLCSVALGRLEVAAGTLNVSGDVEGSRAVRIGMLSDAWTIIDAVHNSRVLLGCLRAPKIVEIAGPYLVATEASSLMRNNMDHLAQKLQNFSRRKGTVAPLYGALRFVREAGDSQYCFVSLPFGSAAQDTATLIMTPDMTPGAGVTSLQLEAFGHDFALQPACTLLEEVLTELAIFAEPALIANLTVAAHGNAEELRRALSPLSFEVMASLTGPVR